MSKIIAVWGAPNSGKTTFATKLALSIYETYSSTVLGLFCNNQTPVLPVIFPNKKADDLYSIGVPLSKTDITSTDVVKSIVTIKNKQNLGFLGYKDCENIYTYPSYDDNKAKAFLTVLKALADFVVVDCSAELDGLSAVAVEMADVVFRLATPDLKNMSFYSSQLPLYGDSKFKTAEHIIGLTINENELYLPTEEMKTYLGDVSFVLPYCREVKVQMLNGELTAPIKNNKYKEMVCKIAQKVV